MNPIKRTKTRSMSWILLFLVVWLLVSPTQGGQAPASPDRRQEFLQMFARAYFPGRSGQIMLVSREGEFVTRNGPAYRFMHGSPWSYDARIPLLLFGPPYIRRGVYGDVAIQQDIAPTLAALLGLPLPPTVTGRSLQKALDYQLAVHPSFWWPCWTRCGRTTSTATVRLCLP